MRIIVGITGASGSVYGLNLLKRLAETDNEVHAVVSDYGYRVLRHECAAGEKEIRSLVHALYPADDIAAPIASGSFGVSVMAIAPCSMRTLAAIASGLAGNLLCRAADVILKERGNLVLAPRETPLNAIHLENMLKLARLGVCVAPCCPGFYCLPENLEDLVEMMTGRIMDCMGIPSARSPRWNGMPPQCAAR